METHTPFLREYIFGNNCIEELKQKIKNLEYKLKTVIADNQDLKKELETLKKELDKTLSAGLKVTVHNDEVKKEIIDGKEIMYITGDSLINMIQQVADDLSNVTQRVRELENK